MGVPPSHFNRIFHEMSHLFWGTPIYGNPHVEIHDEILCLFFRAKKRMLCIHLVGHPSNRKAFYSFTLW